MNITPEISRTCRAALDWSRGDLAKAAGLSEPVIIKYEGGGNVRASTADAIVAAFSANGVTFKSGRAFFTVRARAKAKGET